MRQSGFTMQAKPARIHVPQKIYIRFELMQDKKEKALQESN